jgi:hypothetical protein
VEEADLLDRDGAIVAQVEVDIRAVVLEILIPAVVEVDPII